MSISEERFPVDFVHEKSHTFMIAVASLKESKVIPVVLLAGVSIVAAILRFFLLGEWSFWGDELITIDRALRLFGTPERFSVSLVLTNFALRWFGISEWSARFIPSLLGVLTIPVLYIPIRRIFGYETALLSTLLLAVSPWHLYWSQNSRFYTSLLLFYTLSLLLFYIAVEKKSRWALVFSAAFLFLATRERLVALFILPVIAGYILTMRLPSIYRLIANKRNMVFYLIPIVVVVIAFAGYVVSYYTQFSGFYTDLARNSPIWVVGGAMYYIGIPTIVVGSAGFIYLSLQKRPAAVLFGLGAFVPLLATAFFSFFTYTANRYIFVSLTSWLILAAVGAVELIRNTKGATRLLSAGFLLVLLVMPMSENAMYYLYNHGNRANWKAAIEQVKQQKGESDLVVSSNARVTEYYLGEDVLNFNQVDFSQVRAADSHVWFLEDMVGQAYWPEVHRWIVRNAELVGVYDVQVEARTFRMRVYVFDPERPRTSLP